MKRLTILFSGGSDSLVLWRRALAQGRAPRLLYCRMGHAYEAAELTTCNRLSTLAAALGLPLTVEVVNTWTLLGAREDAATGFIPLRNDLLVRYAALDADEVWLGAVRGESSRDKSQRFLRDSSRSLSYLLGRHVVVRAPLRRETKAEAVHSFLASFPEARALLLATRSCYRLHTMHHDWEGCGGCPACFRRWVAWSLNDLSFNSMRWPPAMARREMRARGGMRGLVLWAAREVPVREWWNVAYNNLQARRAMARVGA